VLVPLVGAGDAAGKQAFWPAESFATSGPS
jgi:hypothetical protein